MSDEISNVWIRLSASTEVPLDGIRFVYDVFDYLQPSPAENAGGPAPERSHCTAAEYCSAFVRLAREKFGADYARALYSWKLESSEKLGRLFYALIDRQFIGKSERDRQSDFDGQFDLRSAVSEPLPQEPYPYTAQLPAVVIARPTPWQQWGELIWVVGLVGCAFAINATLSKPWSPTSAFIVASAVVMGAIVLRSSMRYPYRYSVRALLITMTVVAVALGLAAFFAQ